MKKEWKTPQLITLFRGKPDENATSVNCKHKEGQIPAAPTHANNACNSDTCGTCHNNANRS